MRDKRPYNSGSINPVSTVRSTYRLRLQDGEKVLVESGKEDIQEMINSQLGNSYFAILDRFLEDGVVPSSAYEDNFDQFFLEDFLDLRSAYIENLEDAREAYELSSDMSYSEISAFLQKKYNSIMEEYNNGTSSPENSDQSENVASSIASSVQSDCEMDAQA